MSDRIKKLTLQARKLPPAERAELIDDLLASLDEPDPRIERRAVFEAVRKSAQTKATPGASAARSQDFLYGADGLPE